MRTMSNMHEVQDSPGKMMYINRDPDVTSVTRLDNGRSRVEFDVGMYSYVQDVLPDEHGMLKLDLNDV